MDPIQELREALRRLRERRDIARNRRSEIRTAVDGRPEDQRGLTDDERTELRTLADELETIEDEIIDARDRLDELVEERDRERRAAGALRGLDDDRDPNIDVRSEPLTYQRGDRSHSYFRDLGLALVGRDSDAMERLRQHRSEMDVELPRMERRREQAFRSAMSTREFEGYEVVTRDISRTDGAGGEFVPPLWLLEEYAEYAHAGRPFADHVRNIPLPGGTDSISVPRITGPTSTAPQTADNASVSETDITTSSATGPVRTIAGQQDVALQLLEQSPLVFDEIVFADLIGDYNETVDYQLLAGAGSSGEHTGILTLAGTTAISYTDSSPTVPEFWPSGGQMLSQGMTARKRQLTSFFMHPRRWFWMAGALDGSNRPYVVPAAAGPNNSLAVPMGDPTPEGVGGTWHGMTTRLDMNIPTNLGGGTEDAVIAVRGTDLLLFEGSMRTRALPEVLSGTLTVRLQVYAYSAFIPGRFPSGIVKLTGTGLAAPSGY